MEHANAIYQLLVPCLIALNIWMIRQGIACAKAILHKNEEEHEKLRETCMAHDRRLTRIEARIEREREEDHREGRPRA